MSLVKTNAAQIGQSVTATNNFTIYQPASPDATVRWGVGNSGSVTDIMTLNSSGNVGIGTSSPSGKLQVTGSFNPATVGSIPAIIGGGAYGGGIAFQDTSYAGMYTQDSGGSLVFFTGMSLSDGAASKIKMFIDSSNRVGIGTGTATLTYAFQVQTSTGDCVISSKATASGGAGRVIVDGGGSTSYPGITFSQSATNYWTVGQRGDTNLHLYRESGSGNVVIDAGNLTVAGSVTSTGNTPQVTVYTSGSGTYTVPSGCRWIQVEMVGGGAGGFGSGSAQGTVPTAGGNTTFGASTASGGSISSGYSGSGGQGGAASISGGTGLALRGGYGGPSWYSGVSANWNAGGQGGNSAFGGGGSGGAAGGGAGTAGSTNTGGGGGGGGLDSKNGNAAPGGGSGGYISMAITSLSATYSYGVGAGGNAGGAGTGGAVGGAGGSGVIMVTAYF